MAVRFLRAMKRSTNYVLDAANRAEILAILPADADANTAERIYQMYITESKGGLVPNLELDRKGLLATAQAPPDLGRLGYVAEPRVAGVASNLLAVSFSNSLIHFVV